jgi:type II secretory pathway component GspD/PulD (secretin)
VAMGGACVRVAVLMLAAIALGGSAASRPAGAMEAGVTLDVRDADIHEIVGALLEVPGLQVVFDPGLSCRLTISVKALSWVKVLEESLDACALGYEEDGRVVRIATRARFTQEAADRRRLEEQAPATRPRRLALFRLSYARARELAPLIKSRLSPGGDAVYDERSNTLIIRD